MLLRKRMNRHQLVCMHMNTFPACLLTFTLISALLPVIEQCGETGQRVAATLDPPTGSWPLPLWLAASSHFHSKSEKICSHTPAENLHSWSWHLSTKTHIPLIFIHLFSVSKTHINSYHSISSLCALPYLSACTVSAHQALQKASIFKHIHTA